MRVRHRVRVRQLLFLVALAGLPLLLTGCDAHIDSFNVITHQGSIIENLFLITMAISAVVFLLVACVLIYVMIRYRARPEQGEPPQVTGNRKLEIIWIATPVVLLIILFVLSIRTMNRVDAARPGGLKITVIGHQWWWEYRYPDLHVVTANELHVPVGQPMTLDIQAADVIHSFWVPKFGWKMDAIPGKTNTMQVRVTQPGTWEGTCTEYCGTQHAWMRIRVIAQPKAQFDAWISQQQAAAQAPASAEAQHGEQVFMSNTCVSCHTISGTQASADVGPDLTHFGSRETLGAGVLPNTPENLARWIHQTQEVKPGVLMPSFNLSDQDLAALVAYLEGLR